MRRIANILLALLLVLATAGTADAAPRKKVRGMHVAVAASLLFFPLLTFDVASEEPVPTPPPEKAKRAAKRAPVTPGK